MNKAASPSVKILVGYHKPAVLLKNDLLIPIHVGRASAGQFSKDGIMSESDRQWMHDNMIGDDTGDNISGLNRHFCELTAIYWAWKNYDKIGNPDYIGFMHYRRHFIFTNPSFFPQPPDAFHLCHLDYISNDYEQKTGLNRDTVLSYLAPHRGIWLSNTRPEQTPDQYRTGHPWSLNKYWPLCKEIFYSRHPHMKQDAEEYFNGHAHAWSQMFILPKDIFFHYAETLFDVLFETEKHLDYTDTSVMQQRSIAYYAETLAPAILYHYQKHGELALTSLPAAFIKNPDLPAPLLEPAFAQDNIPVVFSVDQNYLPVLAVAIASLIENKKDSTHYDIIILESDLPDPKKKQLQKLAQRPGISLRFYNVMPLSARYDFSQFMTINHISLSAYYRLLIAEILKNYKKAIYLDCDLLCLTDLSDLYHTDLNGNYAAAVRDCMVSHVWKQWPDFVQYAEQILKIKNIGDYFNSGVMLFNTELIRRDNLLNRLLETAKINNRWFHDQNVLNSVFCGHMHFLKGDYNVLYHLPFDQNRHLLPPAVWQNFLADLENPKILHYSSKQKPWQDAALPKADLFWEYARKTSFYEELIFANAPAASQKRSFDPKSFKLFLNRASVFRSYYRCKILAKITLGKKRTHYKQKRDELHSQVRQIRDFASQLKEI